MKTTDIHDLLSRYRVFLLDAYGVLVNSSGPLPGAREFIDRLNREGYEYVVLTNDASRKPERAAEFYRACGLAIEVSRVMTAGLSMVDALSESGPSACLVLGTDDTRAMVSDAGHRVLDIREDVEPDAIIIADDAGFDFLPTLNHVLSVLHRLALKSQRPRLILANADLLYPKAEKSFAFTAGAMSHLLEEGLSHLHPGLGWKFEVVGKPSRRIFEMALNRVTLPRSQVVMLGDQLATDVSGAKALGLRAALLGTGLTRLPLLETPQESRRPDYLLSNLL